MHIAFIAATAALGGLLFGYDTGVISGALLFLRAAFQLSPLMLGVVTSIALGGAAFGAAFAGRLADRFGRRPILLATSVIFVAGAAVSALAPDLPVLLAGRLLVGLGIGGASMLTPLYLAEIAPAKERGALVSFNQLAVTLGILGSYLIGYALAADGAWRWMLGLGGVPGIVLAIGMLLLPETPRWLAGHGHTDQARAALQQLRGRGADVKAEMAQLRDDLTTKAQAKPENRLGHAAARLPMIVGIGLAIFQQVTGINTVIYFAPTIFQASGLSSASAAILATAGIGVVNVAMTMVAIWLVDRVGRRALLLCGLGGMGISLCLLALGFMIGSGPALGYLTAASLTAYIGCFAIGLGPVFWLLISEIFPMAIRARGMSAATIANWLANLVVALTFLDLADLMGHAGVFLLYAAMTFGGLAFGLLPGAGNQGPQPGSGAGTLGQTRRGEAAARRSAPVHDPVKPTGVPPKPRSRNEGMLRPISKLEGYKIDGSDGSIGTVSDVLFDDATWKLRWLVVDTGHWLTGRKVLLHPSAIGAVDDERQSVAVQLTKARIKDSPGILHDQPVSQQMEAGLYGYYGWDPYWGGSYYGMGAIAAPFSVKALLRRVRHG